VKKTLALLALSALCAPQHSFAQIAYTSTNNTYTQNFDSLGTNASVAWTNNTSLTGWFALASLSNPVTIANVTGSGTTPSGLANFSSNSLASNRSLGWIVGNASGVAGTYVSLGLGISNATGSLLDSFSLAYTGREWRGYSNNTPNLFFQYKIGGSFDNTTTNALSGPGWTDFSALNFVLPVTNANAQVNGLLSPNFTSISNTVTGLTWNSDEVLWVRWRQQNLSGNDAQMAIDDLSFTASVVPEPSTYAMLALAAAGLGAHVVRRRRR